MRYVASGALVAGQLFACSLSFAAEPGADEVVVTAARLQQPLTQVIGGVSVITRQDIEDRLVQSTQDLLRGETGVDIVNNGGPGKLSRLFLRGADAEQVLVLVDGVRVGSATSGATPFELVPVELIERIEIVRGPRSSLYGSDAIGGVIQIFTRKAQGLAFDAGAGSNDTYDAGASFGMSSESAWISASANRLQTEGFNACSGSLSPPGGCFTNEPDRDGYDNTSASVRAGYRWGERAQIEATALHASGNTEFDGGFTNETDFAERVFTLRGVLQPTQSLRLSLLAGETRDEQENLFDDPMLADGPRTTSRFDTQRHNASLQSDLSITDAQTITLGADYLEDSVESTTQFDETSRDNIGVFGQYQAFFGTHQLLLSARHDDNEQFGGYATGSAGWKWAVLPTLSVTAMWGSAFGAPTFNDLYFPGFSNPNLDPERSRTHELGVSGVAGALRWSLIGFENRIDDLIVFNAAAGIPQNLDEARIRGIEAEATAALGEWTLGLGWAGLDARNRSPGANYDNILPRRARQSGHFEVARGFGPLQARMRVTGQGSRYDDVANTRRLGSYALVDLVLDYALTAQWSVQGKVGNLLDREYETVRLFNQDDRTFFFNVRYRPL